MRIFISAAKADKGAVDAEVKQLLKLKEEFKAATNTEWKPGMKPSVSADASGDASNSKDALVAKVNEQGNVVRDLKAKKAGKVSSAL